MDDLEKKNNNPDELEDEVENENKPVKSENDKTEDVNIDPSENEESEKQEESEENELSELVSQLKSKNEEKILKDEVQDWDGLVDRSQQDAEEFVLGESADISKEKLESIEIIELDEDDERLCSICHRRLKYSENGVEYEYCKRCRKELLETKYNWKSVVAFVVSCVVFVFATALSGVAILNGAGTAKAEKLVEEKKYTSAYNMYSNILQSSEGSSSYAPFSLDTIFGIDVGRKAQIGYLEALYKLGSIQNIGTTVESYFTDKDLEKEKYADVKKYKEVYDELYEVSTQATVIVQELTSKDPITKSDVEKTVKELEEMKKDGKYNKAFVAYYQYYATLMASDTYDMQVKYLNELKQGEPELTQFYRMSFANIYLTEGDYDKCIAECNVALKENAEDMSAYRMKVKALYRQKKYDEALELSQKAIEVSKEIYEAGEDETQIVSTKDITYAYSIYTEQAVVFGLKGDMKAAQTAIDKAYQGQLTLDTAYLYAMISKKNGNTEAYEQIMAMLEQYGMELPEVCKQYINGTKTFEDIFVDGEVEWYK